MIRSMTGYGSAELASPSLRASVSARSLNHRFLDLTLHVPRRFQALERELRDEIARTVKRGRVEVSIQVAAADIGGGAVVASRPLVASLVRTLRDMQNEFGLEGGASVADLVRYPGALERLEDVDPPPEGLRRDLVGLLARALEGLEAMRASEGRRLEEALVKALEAVLVAVGRIEERSVASREERKAALRERVQSLVADLEPDEARLYQEVVRAVERHDVAEEVERLRSHVAAARELLESGGDSPGKRLDFLAQELMREANTIGSKVQDATAIQEVVVLKAEIERFREQVQNVE